MIWQYDIRIVDSTKYKKWKIMYNMISVNLDNVNSLISVIYMVFLIGIDSFFSILFLFRINIKFIKFYV